MTRKRDVSRPYPPGLCSAETLANRLDISRSTLDDYVRLGHLPPAVEVGTQRRWRWSDIEAWIRARNELDAPAGDGPPFDGDDPFMRGIANAKAAQV
jgi:excisionase family DNA binding protein